MQLIESVDKRWAQQCVLFNSLFESTVRHKPGWISRTMHISVAPISLTTGGSISIECLESVKWLRRDSLTTGRAQYTTAAFKCKKPSCWEATTWPNRVQTILRLQGAAHRSERLNTIRVTVSSIVCGSSLNDSCQMKRKNRQLNFINYCP